MSKDDWAKISIRPEEHGYLLVYILEQDKRTVDLINNISDLVGLDVINFSSNVKFKREVKKASHAGPQEFLGYFENAGFVLTNSFHGTIFSIIFQKEFYSILPQNSSSRIRDLLARLSLSNRLLDPVAPFGAIDENGIEFADVEGTLRELRLSSLNFIKNSLEKDY